MMNRTLIFFIYTFLLILIIPLLFPQLRLLFFAPFLVMTYYQKDKITSLWWALLAGLVVDLLSSHQRLGFYAFNYCLTTLILYSYKQNFFEDRLTTFPIMTYLFVFISTLLQASLMLMIGQGFAFSLKWLSLDLIWLPIHDAVYAAIAFTLPSLFLSKPTKKRAVLFSPKGH